MSVLWLQHATDVRSALVDLVEGLAAAGGGAHELLDPQVVWHDTLLPLEQQPVRGAAAVAAIGTWLRAAMPDDLQMRVTEVASVEDGHALLYYTATGTCGGPLQPSVSEDASSSSDGGQQQQPQSGDPISAPVSWTGSVLVQLQGQAGSTSSPMRIKHAWHSWDPLFLLQQAGLAPRALPAAPPPAPEQQPAAADARLPAAVDTPADVERAKAVVRQYLGIYNSGELNRLPHIVDDAYEYHGLIDVQRQRGVPCMRAMMAGWRDALEPFAIRADMLLTAEGGRVLFRWVVQGQHTKAPLRGVPAPADGSARSISSCGVTALSITDGADGQPQRIWRKVSHANGAQLLHQLGVLPFAVSAPAQLLGGASRG